MKVVSRITNVLRNLRRSDRGSVAVEFVLAAPILIGAIVIPAELGKALYINNSLEQGLREATRYLSRAPLDSSGAFYASDVTVARQFVLSRLPVRDDEKAVTIVALVTIAPSAASEALGTEFRRLEVQAAAVVRVPLLRAMNLFGDVDPDVEQIVIASRDQSRYFGD